MIVMVQSLVFVGGFFIAMVAIVTSVVPQWDRIIQLASGRAKASSHAYWSTIPTKRLPVVRRGLTIEPQPDLPRSSAVA